MFVCVYIQLDVLRGYYEVLKYCEIIECMVQMRMPLGWFCAQMFMTALFIIIKC